MFGLTGNWKETLYVISEEILIDFLSVRCHVCMKQNFLLFMSESHFQTVINKYSFVITEKPVLTCLNF
jgi:hypothetical protein